MNLRHLSRQFLSATLITLGHLARRTNWTLVLALGVLVGSSACSSRIIMRDGSTIRGTASPAGPDRVNVDTNGDEVPDLVLMREDVERVHYRGRAQAGLGGSLLALGVIGTGLTAAFTTACFNSEDDPYCGIASLIIGLPVSTALAIAGTTLLSIGLPMRGRARNVWQAQITGTGFRLRYEF